jgi:hypothetical protein
LDRFLTFRVDPREELIAILMTQEFEAGHVLRPLMRALVFKRSPTERRGDGSTLAS